MLNNFEAYKLARDVYQRCRRLRLPRFHQDQLHRAASSVALNLAEGSGRRSKAEQLHFYSIAYGSVRECRAILELENVKDEMLLENLNHLGAMTFKLCRPDRHRKSNLQT